MTEAEFLAALRTLPLHPGARGLLDDAAVLEADGAFVLTHDTMVEGVHFLAADPPESVAWRIVAVNLSDLAAKGATPVGVLLSYPLHPEAEWNARFLQGFGEALEALEVTLLGGDTVSAPGGAARSYGLTAVGRAPACGAPSRSGARPGDRLWVTGHIGDAGEGLAIAKGERIGPDSLTRRYLRPLPRIRFGPDVAPHVHAMMDVSDGLLIDAARMAKASGLALSIDLGAVPLSRDLLAVREDGRDLRLAAATAGDDYELLFTAPPAADAAIRARAERDERAVTVVGEFAAGEGLTLAHDGAPVPLPPRLGFEHRG